MKVRITLAVCLFATFFATSLWSQSPSQGPTQPTNNLNSAILSHLLRLPNPSSLVAGSALAKKTSLSAASPHLYSFASADFPGAAQTQVTGVNVGTTVGIFLFNPKVSETTKSFTFSGGTYRIFSVPGAGAGGTAIFTINGNGQIAGEYADSAQVIHGFVDTAGTFTNIDYPGATVTAVADISLNNEIVGVWQDAATQHGFTDIGGTFTSIDFPGATLTEATGVNSAGEVVGYYTDAANVEHGFIYLSGQFNQLDAPLSKSTIAFGINDNNVISGWYTDGTGVIHGFVYAKGVFNTVDVPGAASTQLTHINNWNKFAGFYGDQLQEVHGLTGH